MKNKIKKIVTATVLSALSFTAIGCGTNNNKIAKNIDSSMAKFVSSINNLDYVDTTKPNEKVGKLVETSSPVMQNRYSASSNQYLSKGASYSTVESAITKPEYRTDSFKLFVLSDSPFITLSTGDNMASLNIGMRFSTDKIENTSTEIQEKINTLILKRSILMIYVNEIYNGNVNLTDENKVAINAYVNVIKENTSYLNGNRGMVKNQLKLASDLTGENQNSELINYYIIKSGEALETRLSKLDSTLSAIDSIINIIENSLTSASSYYQNSLSDTYDKFLTNMSSDLKSNDSQDENSNQKIAKNIAETLNLVQISPKIDKICENCENKTDDQQKEISEKVSPISPNPISNNQSMANQNSTLSTSQNNTLSANQNRGISTQSSYTNQAQQSSNGIASVPENNKILSNSRTNSSTLSNSSTGSSTNSTLNSSSNRTTSNSTISGTTNPSFTSNRTSSNSFTSNRTSNNSGSSNQLSSADTVIKPAPTYSNGSTKNRYHRSNLVNSNRNTTSSSNRSVVHPSTNETNKENSTLDRQKIMRARRTPEQEKQEEYTSSSNNNLDFYARQNNNQNSIH